MVVVVEVVMEMMMMMMMEMEMEMVVRETGDGHDAGLACIAIACGWEKTRASSGFIAWRMWEEEKGAERPLDDGWMYVSMCWHF